MGDALHVRHPLPVASNRISNFAGEEGLAGNLDGAGRAAVNVRTVAGPDG